MSRGACTFRQRDLAAALRAAKQAGVPVARWKINKDGELVFETGEPNGSEPQTKGGKGEWDE
jgi:hypothetical protein